MRIVDSHLNVVILDHGKTICKESIHIGGANVGHVRHDFQNTAPPAEKIPF